MNAKPKVGVSIPVYNDAESLKACVESVQGQTLKDLEIWIVDDGSTDGSGAIADEIAAKDGRVHVLHQVNKGNYAARVAGILNIEAEYFTSVDADDCIEPDMFEQMVDLAERESLDVVECDLSLVKDADGSTVVYKGKKDTYEKVILPVFVEGYGFSCVCGKLYRRALLDEDACKKSIIEEQHSRISLFEDALFNIQIMHAVSSYGVVHSPFYKYQISENSSVRNFNPENIDGFCRVVEVRSKMASYYGIRKDDVRLSNWVIKNVFNLVQLASYAKARKDVCNSENVRRLLQLSVLDEAIGNLRKSGCRSMKTHLLCLFRKLPPCFVVSGVRLIRRLKH